MFLTYTDVSLHVFLPPIPISKINKQMNNYILNMEKHLLSKIKAKYKSTSKNGNDTYTKLTEGSSWKSLHFSRLAYIYNTEHVCSSKPRAQFKFVHMIFSD